MTSAAGRRHRTAAVATMVATSERPQPFRHLLAAPWFYRVGFVAARAVPVPVLYAIADGLGVATYLTCGKLVTAVGANLACAFPQVSARERSRLTQRIFRNYARYLVDYGRLRWARRDGFEGLIPALEGEDHLRRALAAGRGVILVTGHVGNWELGGTFFGQSGVKVHVVTLPDGHRQIDAIRERYRARYAISTIVLDGSPFASLEMMAALKRNEMVAMLVDRWGPTDGIASPFFGGTHHLPRGPFVLSRATGAPILSAFVVRDGASYRGIVEPPFVVAEEDLSPYAARISGALERVIRRYPDQWYSFVPL